MPIEKHEFDSQNNLSKQIITLDNGAVEFRAPDGTVICTIDPDEKSVTLGDGATSDGFGGGGGLEVGDSLPETCSVGDTFLRTGNTAAGLYVCKTTNVWSPAGELKTTVTLNNAQIKALPTTPVEIVAAAGIGKFIQPVFATLAFSRTADLANVNAGGVVRIVNDNTSRINILKVASAPDLLADGHSAIVTMGQIDPDDWSGNSPSDFDNVALYVDAFNSSDGDFEDGHPDNTLTVTVYYMVVNV